jgi:hypothetical protein
VHELIASPFLGNYIVTRPGSPNGIKIPASKYQQLRSAAVFPDWLAQTAMQAWDIELSGEPTGNRLLVRAESPYGYGRATYELNLGCNYDCEHCYLDRQ